MQRYTKNVRTDEKMIVKKIKSIEGEDRKKICQEVIWDKQASLFKKCNMLYGKNGIGKSSISKMLANIEHYKDCLGLENGVTQDKIKVFNEDFIKKEVYFDSSPIENSDLINRLYIGKDRVENQKELEKIAQTLNDLKKEEGKLEKKLDKNLSSWAKQIKDRYFIEYNVKDCLNYNKGDLKENLEELITANSKDYLKKEEISELENIAGETAKETIDDFKPIEQNDIPKQREKVLELLREKVESKTIDSLIKDIKANNWVKDGVDLHYPHKKDGKLHCKFCDNIISDSREKELKDHFNESYQKVVDSIKNAIDECKDIKHLELDIDKVYEEYKKKLATKIKDINLDIDEYNGYQKVLKLLLEKRQKNILNPIEEKDIEEKDIERLNNIPDISLERDIKEANSLITKNNDYSKDIENKKKIAVKRLVRDYQIKYLSKDYEEFKKNIADNAREKKKCEEEHKKIEEELEKIKASSSKVKAINEELERCLKPQNIRFNYNSEIDAYRVERDGDIAHNLSHGEINIISLIYFFAILGDDEEKLKEQCIVKDQCIVIDDPVSSLDEENFYYILGKLEDSIRISKQVIILTHQFRLLEQFYHINEKNKQLYMMKHSSGDNSTKNIAVKSVNKETTRFLSEYTVIFEILWNIKKKPIPIDIQNNRNNMRRLIEAFCSFHFPNKMRPFKDAIKEFLTIETEEGKEPLFNIAEAKTILHEGSHSLQIQGSNQIDCSSDEKTRELLERIFEAIKYHNFKHYNGILEIIDPEYTKEQQPKSSCNDNKYKDNLNDKAGVTGNKNR